MELETLTFTFKPYLAYSSYILATLGTLSVQNMLSSPRIRACEAPNSLNGAFGVLKMWWKVAALIKELPKEVLGSPDFL